MASSCRTGRREPAASLLAKVNAAGSWWTSEPRPSLSQGDVVAEVPFCIVSDPVTHLKHVSLRGNKPGWAEHPTPVIRASDQKKYILSHGDIRHALVLSHDCDLDKPRANQRVLVAPIGQLAGLDPALQTTVLEQRHLALMPLPSLAALGDSYADMRLLAAVPRKTVLDENRVASLTDDARYRLQVQILKFLFRREPPPPA